MTTCMATLMLNIMINGIYYDGSRGVIIDPLGTLGPIGLDARDVRSCSTYVYLHTWKIIVIFKF